MCAKRQKAPLILAGLLVIINGLAVSASDLTIVKMVVGAMADIFFSINNYGKATEFTEQARAIWAFNLLLIPVLLPVYLKISEGGKISDKMKYKQAYNLFKILTTVFIILIIVGPVVPPSNSSGKYSILFNESLLGMCILASLIWFCFYISIGVVLYTKKVMKYDSNKI